MLRTSQKYLEHWTAQKQWFERLHALVSKRTASSNIDIEERNMGQQGLMSVLLLSVDGCFRQSLFLFQEGGRFSTMTNLYRNGKTTF